MNASVTYRVAEKVSKPVKGEVASKEDDDTRSTTTSYVIFFMFYSMFVNDIRI